MASGNLDKGIAGRRWTAATVLSAIVFMLQSAFVGVSAQTTAKSLPAGTEGGRSEGIAVHGHWTIEVRNPDGALVERREFENALVGRDALVQILASGTTPGEWWMVLGNQNLCSSAGGCLIAQHSTGSNHLVLSTPTAGPNAHSLVLAATPIVAPGIGDDGETPPPAVITGVSTEIHPCGANVTPSDCAAANNLIGGRDQNSVVFTSTNITPLSLSPGQIVQVTVAISFSSPSTLQSTRR